MDEELGLEEERCGFSIADAVLLLGILAREPVNWYRISYNALPDHVPQSPEPEAAERLQAIRDRGRSRDDELWSPASGSRVASCLERLRSYG